MRFSLLKVLFTLWLAASVFLTLSSFLVCTHTKNDNNKVYRKLPANPAPNAAGDAKVLPNVQWADLDQSNSKERPEGLDPRGPSKSKLERIDCLINQEYTVDCRKKGEEVYLPFSFIEKYFEVYGQLRNISNQVFFEWNHSNSLYQNQTEPYSPTGVYMSFDHVFVEGRERVKCVSGIEGVPVSKQWASRGHFYPIQIAQFGLSHWSKYRRDNRRTIIVVEDAEKGTTEKWMIPDTSLSVDNVIDDVTGSRVIKINAPESLQDPGASIDLNTSTNFFLSLDFLFDNNGSFTVTVQSTVGAKRKLYFLHYVCSKIFIEVKGNAIFYGIGNQKHWRQITRDIYTDIRKGVQLEEGYLLRVLSLTFHGRVLVDNVTLSDNAHLTQFSYAVKWLVKNQDSRGGWPVTVTRVLAKRTKLNPGWYSAMAQGQAMSLLVRAYKHTGEQKYLDAALRGTLLFDVPSAKGGVLAKFLDEYPWYEEYPTVPSSFVLNGFIYSLVGLYDLKEAAPPELGKDAERLYAAGMKSLKLMLPFYDTGSGTVYDLRHVTLGVEPRLTRWEYHGVHITQLSFLTVIDKDPVFRDTMERWVGYMKGKRARHN